MGLNLDKRISNLLIKWYEQNKRDLPWRNTDNPYIIWISEVILQQTRVDQGYSYFVRFTDRFPTVSDLAAAEEDEVLKLWQGLGYYSRARNLHHAAKDIVSRFGGSFPTIHKDVLSLKGIGEYTAAAIVSFAYKQPYAVVDGNVFRVISRLFAIDEPIDSTSGKKLFAQIAQQLLDENDPGTHNQAIMELGALQCIPVNPDCNQCPTNSLCLAFAQNKVSSYPVKQGKITVKNRFFNYLDIRYGDKLYLQKRTEKDIWQNLYEFPLFETVEETDIDELLKDTRFIELFGDQKVNITPKSSLKHILSHRIINARFYTIEIDTPLLNHKFIEIDRNDVHNFATSRLVHKYIEENY